MSTQVDISREMDMARNMFGHLKPEIRKRLQAVVDRPSQRTWNNAYSIVIGADGWMTLWQAVIQVDPRFPRSKRDARWPEIPSRETLIQALRYATH